MISSARLVIGAVGAIAVLTAVLIGASRLDGDSTKAAQGGPAGIVVFAKGGLPEALTTETFQAVGSGAELEAASEEANVIILDSASLLEVSEQFLKSRVAEGVALVGIDVSLSDLREKVGFSGLLRAVEPKFAENLRNPDALKESGYSYLWFWSPTFDATWWGSGQHLMSDGLFDAVLAELSLNGQGLTTDEAGQVVPLH